MRPTGIIRTLPWGPNHCDAARRAAYHKMMAGLNRLNNLDQATVIIGLAQKPRVEILHFYLLGVSLHGGTLVMSEYRERIYRLANQIPKGCVMTYGQIAEILDSDDGAAYTAQTVGWAMHALGDTGPWARVINAQGACSTGRVMLPGNKQQFILESEGVVFDENGRCDLQKYLWIPNSPFVICRLPVSKDSKPTYRTMNGGWAGAIAKAEHFHSREAAQTVISEHSWGRDGHTVEELKTLVMNQTKKLELKEYASKNPHGTHGTRARYVCGCRCMLCRAANSRYETMRAAERRAGRSNHLVSSAPSRRHLIRLSKAGVGRRAVSDVTGIGCTCLAEIRGGRKLKVRAQTEQKILAVSG